MRKLILFMILGCLSGNLDADFKCQMTVQERVNGKPTSKNPSAETKSWNGSRSVNVSSRQRLIIDLDKETITVVDVAKKTYTVTTFARNKQDVVNIRAKMLGPGQDPTEFRTEMSAKETGVHKTILGADARQVFVTMALRRRNGEDVPLAPVYQGSGNATSGPFLLTSEMWLAPEPLGYEEVRAFDELLAEKMQEAPLPNDLKGAPVRVIDSGGRFNPLNPSTVYESTFEYSNCAQETVDAAMFEIPAGFREVKVKEAAESKKKGKK